MATDYAKVHFSSLSVEWETPQGLFDELAKEFAFDLDVCATPQNHKVDRYFTEEQDGLGQVWAGICWMNPPYGRGISAWIEKAFCAAIHNGATVVCLLPARTDTRWFHDFCVKGEIRFVKGRLKFGKHYNSAPFPSMIVIFRPPQEAI